MRKTEVREQLQSLYDLLIIASWEDDEVEGIVVGDADRAAASALLTTAGNLGLELASADDDLRRRSTYPWERSRTRWPRNTPRAA